MNRGSLLREMPYRATERTEARRAAARERILDAAHELVARGGFGAASVAAVAERAGVATGSVYRHFSSKADLFAEVFRRAAQREVDAVAGAATLALSGGSSGRPPGGGSAPAPGPAAGAGGGGPSPRRARAGGRRAGARLAEPVDPVVEAERLAFRRAYRDGFERLVGDELTAAALVGAIGEVLVGPLSPTGSYLDEDRLVAELVSLCERLGGR